MNGKQIKETRIRVGLSQNELAEKLGVSQPTISLWERSRGQPSPAQFAVLKSVLGSPEKDDTAEASALAAWLTKQRVAKGYSVPELAHRSGLTPPAIYRIEAGVTRNLRDATRKKLEAALGSDIPEETAQELADEAEIKGHGK